MPGFRMAKSWVGLTQHLHPANGVVDQSSSTAALGFSSTCCRTPPAGLRFAEELEIVRYLGC